MRKRLASVRSSVFRRSCHSLNFLYPAAVYTEMNATSKGVALKIFDKGKEKGMEATKDGSQPYVELMGRR